MSEAKLDLAIANMARPYITTGIDVGNAFVKTVVAELDRDVLRPKIIGVGIAPSHGLRKGVVVDMDEAVRDIGESVKRAETMSGVKVNRAYAAVNGLHIKSQLSRGVIAVSRADNEISAHDIDRVVEAASIVSLPANREIIHVIPKNYLVDGQEYVKNPLGMKGVRLEAEVLIIDGLSPYMRNLAKCLNANEIEVAEFVFSPIASSRAVLDKNQKEHGVIVLDLGSGVSTLSFFHEGELAYAAVLPIGARHVTNDLAVALRTSMDLAEEVKLQYGFAGVDFQKNVRLASSSRGKDDIDLSELLSEENFIIPRKNVIRVIDARVGEIFDVMQSEMKKIPQSGLIPAGIVLTGGGAKLPGLNAFVKNKLRLPVRIGSYFPFDGLAEGTADPSLAVAAGLVMRGLEKEFSNVKVGLGVSLSNRFSLFNSFFSWLKNFLP